ncbi:RBBP9/YdeN family alpha/beta hydrolase [Rickettsia endosymbiont of Halotydeus destructor]|uniref:RBBP9/YdeN family alpha/beta hydrolase n=1 Tax=Rickettsia endosymbiont of Halotydeus destructor TaxID=2996754 RepID=UPI003BAF7C0F
MKKVILIPGNGGGSPNDNWFPSIRKDLELNGLQVISAEFPDNDLARASFWLPFLLDELKADENTILIGHSTGAIAAIRLAEIQPIFGSVLVGAYHTDLNMEKEKLSGYFDKPWDFEKIKQNQKWISLFASQDDPWIPIEEPRYIHTKLNCEYHEYTNLGHFGGDYYKQEFPEVTRAIIQNLQMMDK